MIHGTSDGPDVAQPSALRPCGIHAQHRVNAVAVLPIAMTPPVRFEFLIMFSFRLRMKRGEAVGAFNFTARGLQ
jgi:hypothetical protein